MMGLNYAGGPRSALFFGGLWGVFVFGEIEGRAAIGTFFAGGATLVTGAALLAIGHEVIKCQSSFKRA
jgi:hypothetical protein